MTTLDDLIPFVAPEVPGATDEIIRMRLHEALRRFCQETGVWTEEIDIDSVADQAAYDVEPSYEAYILRVLSVKTRTSTSISFDGMNPDEPSRYKLNDDALGITFYDGYEPSESVTTGIRVKAALMPQTTAEEFSGILLDRYGEGLYSLAKSLLMKTPKTPYFNPDLAKFYYDVYDVARANAVKEGYTENKNVNTQIQQLGRYG